MGFVKLAFVFNVLAMFFFSGAALGEIIKIYTYHSHPPFITEEGKGLTFDVEEKLNEAGNKNTEFKLTVLPRKRLNMILENWINGSCMNKAVDCDDNWILLWVNQKWGFGKDPYRNFNWVEMMGDSNVIVFRKDSGFEYKGPESLKGLKFGGVLGHKYVGIDNLVKEGKIERINGKRERDNILKLYKKRVDAILLPSSTVQYYLTNDFHISNFSKELYISPQKHQIYTRNVMIPSTRHDLKELLEEIDLSAGTANSGQ